MRQEFTAKTKLLAFERCKGYCQKCSNKLSTGKIRYNHLIPDGIGGSE